jgi:hypothetical protein
MQNNSDEEVLRNHQALTKPHRACHESGPHVASGKRHTDIWAQRDRKLRNSLIVLQPQRATGLAGRPPTDDKECVVNRSFVRFPEREPTRGRGA